MESKDFWIIFYVKRIEAHIFTYSYYSSYSVLHDDLHLSVVP